MADEGYVFYSNLLGMSRDFHKGYGFDPYNNHSRQAIIKRDTYDALKEIKVIEYVNSRITKEFHDPVQYLVSACLETERLNVFNLNKKDVYFDKVHTERLLNMQPYIIERQCKQITQRFPELRENLLSTLLAFSELDVPELISKRLRYGLTYEIYLILDTVNDFMVQSSIRYSKHKDVKKFVNKFDAYSRYFVVSEEMKDVVIDYFY